MSKYTNTCTESAIKIEPLTMDFMKKTVKFFEKLDKKDKENRRREQFLKEVVNMGIQTPKPIYCIEI